MTTAINETKRLMEQLHADILIGPLSGDEAVAIANYAKAHPTQTFINGTSGAQDPTLQIGRRTSSASTVTARSGTPASATSPTTSSTGGRPRSSWTTTASRWTSAAGMIADFCAVGGQITKRVFPPLNTTDYSSYVRQLPPPNKVDGYFWVVGGTGTVASLKAFEQAYGPLKAKKFVGNLFFGVAGNFQSIAPRINGAYVGGFGTPGIDYQTPAAKAYVAAVSKSSPRSAARGDERRQCVQRVLLQLLQGRRGRSINGAQGRRRQVRRSAGRSSRRSSKVVLNTPFGVVKLDKNRQAIEGEWSYQIAAKARATTDVNDRLSFIPNVDQTFSGAYSRRRRRRAARSRPASRSNAVLWHGEGVRPVVKNGGSVATNHR